MIRSARDDSYDVLVIQVWHEPGSGKPFRARVNVRHGGADVLMTSFADQREVLEAVREWLAERPDSIDHLTG